MSSQVSHPKGIEGAFHVLYTRIRKQEKYEKCLFFCRNCKKYLMLSSRKEVIEHLKLHRKKQEQTSTMFAIPNIPQDDKPKPRQSTIPWRTARHIYLLLMQNPERRFTYQQSVDLFSAKDLTVHPLTIERSLRELRHYGKLDSSINAETREVHFWLKKEKGRKG